MSETLLSFCWKPNCTEELIDDAQKTNFLTPRNVNNKSAYQRRSRTKLFSRVEQGSRDGTRGLTMGWVPHSWQWQHDSDKPLSLVYAAGARKVLFQNSATASQWAVAVVLPHSHKLQLNRNTDSVVPGTHVGVDGDAVVGGVAQLLLGGFGTETSKKVNWSDKTFAKVLVWWSAHQIPDGLVITKSHQNGFVGEEATEKEIIKIFVLTGEATLTVHKTCGIPRNDLFHVEKQLRGSIFLSWRWKTELTFLSGREKHLTKQNKSACHHHASTGDVTWRSCDHLTSHLIGRWAMHQKGRLYSSPERGEGDQYSTALLAEAARPKNPLPPLPWASVQWNTHLE